MKRKNKETGEKRKREKLIHTDKQTYRQTDGRTNGRTDRHKSFNDMRYYTVQNLFIQINSPTDKQTDGQTDRHKSFNDMRYYTEQYSKSNSTKENRIKSNQINLK